MRAQDGLRAAQNCAQRQLRAVQWTSLLRPSALTVTQGRPANVI